MKTPAEKFLITKIIQVLKNSPGLDTRKIINLGAGKSVFIENSIISDEYKFICDRLDVIDCSVNNPLVGSCFISSIESMPMIKSESYMLAFANYVLEHIARMDKASKEIYRVLKHDGVFILTLPNPTAPEFILSRHTPLWFHRFIRGKGEGNVAFKTHYAYKNIDDLVKVFLKNKFSLLEIKYYSFTYAYLHRFPIFEYISKLYDKLINHFGFKRLMGNVCIVFKK